jgi:hypothetical protein
MVVTTACRYNCAFEERARDKRERERGIEKEGGSPPADDRGMFPKESFEKEKKKEQEKANHKDAP